MGIFGFAGKRVAVTGSYSGMGRAAVEHLLADGAEVHALDLRENELAVTSFQPLDLRDPAAIDQAATKLARSLDGPLDVLLNCAGLPHSSFTAPDIMQVNFFGLRRLTEAMLPAMTSGGAIASIASKAGINWPEQLDAIQELLALGDDDAAGEWFAARPELAEHAYGFSKACVIVYTMARAAHLAPRGIRMNAISPGATDTPMMEHFRKKRTDEQLRKSTGGIGRMSRPEEQALPLLFLAADAASYVSGVNLVIDGGALGGFVTGELAPPEVPQYAGVRGGAGIGA
ncbi:coniferyl-alcohol dehydrogenase [Spirillospora sp. NPDC048819]|uniref:coniferyl-alcohol dehydrogenase n=1 Tax=Spirillospora sp. NPDC048819 TaxID=3155268 RepID=UPI003409A76E